MTKYKSVFCIECNLDKLLRLALYYNNFNKTFYLIYDVFMLHKIEPPILCKLDTLASFFPDAGKKAN